MITKYLIIDRWPIILIMNSVHTPFLCQTQQALTVLVFRLLYLCFQNFKKYVVVEWGRKCFKTLKFLLILILVKYNLLGFCVDGSHLRSHVTLSDGLFLRL
jgi:hypothetical protein